nr:9550_t:CDS:2 [Entrophospora candida]
MPQECCFSGCGCQKFKPHLSLNDENKDLCRLFGHDEGWHKQEVTTSTISNINQINLQNSNNSNNNLRENIQNFLSSERTNTYSSSIIQNSTMVGSSSSLPYNIQQSCARNISFDIQRANLRYSLAKNKRKNNTKKIKKVSFQIIVLDKDVYIIPAEGDDKWNYLENHSYIKTIEFDENSNEYINRKIINNFPILNTGWKIYRPESTTKLSLSPFSANEPYTLKILKSAATKRQRLYLKPDMRNSNLSQNNYDSDNLIESTSEMMDNEMVDSRLITETDITTSNIDNIYQLSTTTHSNNFHNQSTSTNLTNQNNEMFDTTNSIFDSKDSSNIDFFSFIDGIKNELEALHIDAKNKSIHITIAKNNIILLYEWVKKASITDIISKPCLEIIGENVIDSGGAFREMTQYFWDNIEFLQPEWFNNGMIAEDMIVVDEMPLYLGKLMFWCFIHHGAWPKWFDPFQIEYIMGAPIDVNERLKEKNRYLYKIFSGLKNQDEVWLNNFLTYADSHNFNVDKSKISCDEAANLLSNHYIIEQRKKNLELFKEGFNFLGIIDKFKVIGWKKIENVLYSKLSSTELLAQMDSNTLFFTTKQKKLFNEFYNFIKEINDVEMIEKILKFIEWRTCEGKLLHKLAYASTCSNTLILCEDYEISTQGFAQFRNDLIEAFYNCEGFSEKSYNHAYLASSAINTSYSNNDRLLNINTNQPEIIDLESNNLSNEINSFPLYSNCNSHSSPQQPSFQMSTQDQLQHNPYIRNNSNNNGNNNVQRRYRQRQRSNNNNFEFINYSIDNYVNGNQH